MWEAIQTGEHSWQPASFTFENSWLRGLVLVFGTFASKRSSHLTPTRNVQWR
jgi:hypothetical protein